MMHRRWLIGLCLLAGLVLGFLTSGHWIGPYASQILTLTSAQFSLRLGDGSETPPEEVSLPHKWPITGVPEEALGIYRIPLPQELPPAGWAVSLADHMPDTTTIIASKSLIPTAQKGHAGEVMVVELGRVPPGQTLAFSVPAHFGLRGGLGVVQLGPKDSIQRRAFWLSSLRAVSHLWIIGMALVVALFSWGAYLGSGYGLLAPLAVAASGICLHHGLPFIWGYWEGDGFELALYSASSTLTGFGLFFLLEQATRHKRDAITYAVALGLPWVIWIQFGHFFEFETRRVINVGYLATLMITSCLRHAPRALAQRQWLLLLVLVFFVVRAIFAVRSLIANHGGFGFDDVEHQVRLTPLAILAAMLLGARHIHMAFKNHEMANIGMAREIETYKAELALLSRKEQALAVQQAASAERLHWMQEIHDGLGSHLIAARFLADKATDPGGLDAVRESIDDSLEDLRELVESLSPEQSTLPSLLGALRYRIAPRYERAGLRLLWSVDPMIEAAELSPADALNVQRITQEALTNILKHAQATTVRVHIFTRGSSIVLRIEDDGRGFDPDLPYPGRGIENMKKRARDCKGELTLTPIDPGMRVELSLPND